MKPTFSVRPLLAFSALFALTHCSSTATIPLSELSTENPQDAVPKGYIAFSISFNAISEINRPWHLTFKIRNERTKSVRKFTIHSNTLRGIPGEPVLFPLPPGEWAVDPLLELAMDHKIYNNVRWSSFDTTLNLTSDPLPTVDIEPGDIFHMGFLSLSTHENSISSDLYSNNISGDYDPFAHVPAALWDMDLKKTSHPFKIYEMTQTGFVEQKPFESLKSKVIAQPADDKRSIQFFANAPFTLFLMVTNPHGERRVRLESVKMDTPEKPIQVANIELKPDEKFSNEGICFKEILCLSPENDKPESIKNADKPPLKGNLVLGDVFLPKDKKEADALIKSVSTALKPFRNDPAKTSAAPSVAPTPTPIPNNVY